MKKIIAVFFALMLSVLASTSLNANEINVTIDDVAVDFEGQGPTIVNGRAFVPVRAVFEALGFDVRWYDTGVAVLTSEDYEILIFTDIPLFMVNYEILSLDVPPQNIGGRMMMPIRDLLINLGYFVSWNHETSTVVVNSTHDVHTITIGNIQHSTAITVLRQNSQYLQNEDITSLRYLTDLFRLEMTNNQISDLTPLAELTSLSEINLWNNQISDISPLEGLVFTSLGQLSLEYNQITDISPLANVTGITFLNLSGNPIEDWSPVAHIERVTGRPWNWEQLIDD